MCSGLPLKTTSSTIWHLQQKKNNPRMKKKNSTDRGIELQHYINANGWWVQCYSSEGVYVIPSYTYTTRYSKAVGALATSLWSCSGAYIHPHGWACRGFRRCMHRSVEETPNRKTIAFVGLWASLVVWRYDIMYAVSLIIIKQTTFPLLHYKCTFDWPLTNSNARNLQCYAKTMNFIPYNSTVNLYAHTPQRARLIRQRHWRVS